MGETAQLLLEHGCPECGQMIQITAPIRVESDLDFTERMMKRARQIHASVNCFAQPDEEQD